MKHSETKRCGRIYRLLWVISGLLNLGPLAVFTVMGFADGSIHPASKLCLGATMIAVIIMTAVCVINKVNLRSRLWIALIGLWFCLDYVLPILLAIGACQILDELVITPIKNNYHAALITNKTVDKRGG